MACHRRFVGWVLVGLLGAGVFGCEAIAKVDRDLIPDEPAAGAGGAAGHDGGLGGAAGKGGGGSGGIAGKDGGDASDAAGGKGGGDAGGAGGKDGGGGTDAGGTGGAPECTVPGDCPVTANECISRTCTAGKCGTEDVASGTKTATQTPGDCKVSQCDGNGAVVQATDDADLPVDNVECTDDVCTAGSPTNPPSAKGTPCGSDLACDGSGQCTGCTIPSQCPGVDDECKTRKCDAGTCGFDFASSGKVLTTQVAGDCKIKQCDGAGATIDVNDDSDVPKDNTECTEDVCQNGVPSNPNSVAGKACTESGGSYCSGSGTCVQCVVPTTCPGQDEDCKIRSCVSNVCGFENIAVGTKLPDPLQTAGDCKVKQCDGVGNVADVNNDQDLPVDNKDCTNDVCTNGTPSNPPKSSGTTCGTNLMCDSAGNCVGCLSPADCTGTNTECKTKTCTAGTCGWDFAPAGTALAQQTAGDCQVAQCDGAGNTELVPNNSDVPVDASDCTDNICTNGVPSNPPKQSGTTCSTGGGSVCNANGQCVQCLQANTCPGTDTDCHTRTCTAGACGFSNAAAGKPLTQQTAGDCQLAECDGNGGVTSAADNTDKPVDGNLCTADVCVNGVPSNPPEAAGSSCGAPKVCDANGNCVGCNVPADCTGIDTECRTRTCTSGVCGFNYTANGTKVTAQTPKDCKSDVCNGAGLVITINDDLDLPVDNLECTSDVCTAGVPSNPPTAINTTCTVGGTVCNGTGQCVQCNAATQCSGSDTECHVRTCASGTCGVSNMTAGTATSSQTAGDCHQNQCDGNGNIVNAIFNSDVPVDANQCTSDVCTAGVPSNPNSALNTACSQGGGSFCNGGGVCVQCNAATQCAGTDTECHQRTCNSNTCGVFNTPSGTATSSQTAGDCHQNQCDGNGNIVNAIDNADVPVDANECTDNVCTAGVPSNPPTASGAACTIGGNFCNGLGACVQCVAAGTCPGSDTECQTRTCISYTCGLSFQPGGTVTSSQTAGDCHQNQCDGAGAIVNAILDTDVPVDGNVCTNDVCTAGVPSNPLLPAGTSCGAGLACNASGSCVALCVDGVKDGAETDIDCGGGTCPACALGKLCSLPSDCASTFCTGACVSEITFRVLRVGDGSAALGGAATAGFVEPRKLSDGSLAGAIINLPVAVSGANQPLTLAGSSTSEGSLSRSADGRYTTVAGYAAVPGTAGISGTTSAVNNRVVGRIDAAGTVDSSTRFDVAFSAGNIRGAATSDGTGFWAHGSNSGVWYIPLGTTGGTQIMAAPANIRVDHIFGGQLYGSANTGTYVNVFTIGTGLPTSGPVTATSLPGMPTASGPSYYSFALLDRIPGVPGVDTLYVADDRAASSGGGIQKWTFDGSVWTSSPTMNGGLTVGVRGLAAVLTGANVTVIATTTETANRVVAIVDDGSANPPATVLATAATNTAFRGVAISPF
ncbi:MAG: TonB-dependent receptor [Deltaproteobacteria bacterium]|nr:TonB-dependent receptor [Deltaproteobacteria bacterium]